MLPIHVSLAAFPGVDFLNAMERATKGVSEPLLGELSLEHVQLCPQNIGLLTQEYAAGLAEAFPRTQFRLHANCRVLPGRQITNLDRFDSSGPYWLQLATVSQTIGAPAYTAHAGLRANATLAQVLDNTRRASDLFGCTVGVEGHYPTARGIFLLDSWEDYRVLHESGVPYALDLSHLHILAVQSGRRDEGLVREMLANPACIEVHLSGNDGDHDTHETLDESIWWWELLSSTNPMATLFSEGTQPR